MKIVVGGAFSTGKTTLFKQILEFGIFDGTVPDLPRGFQQEFPFVDWMHPATRYFNLLHQCLRESLEESKSANTLCDGGIYECIGHTHVLSEVNFEPQLLKYHKYPYDLVLLCSEEGVGIEDDGLRHTDTLMRSMVQKEITKSLIINNANTLHLVGNPEHRLEQAMEAITNLMGKKTA